MATLASLVGTAVGSPSLARLNAGQQAAGSAQVTRASSLVGKTITYRSRSRNTRSRNGRRPLAVSAVDTSALPSAGLVLVDHFARLQIPRGASNEEIFNAYRTRCKEVTDSKDLDDTLKKQLLAAFETALDVLTSEEEKKLYLWGLLQKEQPGSYAWPYQADPSQSEWSGTPPPVAPEDEEGTTQLGYFFAAWFAVSIVLSLSLK